MKKQRFKGVYGKCIVLLVIGLNIWFTHRVLDIVLQTQFEPSTLIISWFAFTGTELLALAGIKIKKKKSESDEPKI